MIKIITFFVSTISGKDQVLQWKTERRIIKWRDILHFGGSEDQDRKVAGSLQYEAAAYQPGVSTPGAGDDPAPQNGNDVQKLNLKIGLNIGVWSVWLGKYTPIF